MSDVDQLRAERDLYRRLLDVGTHDALAPFLEDALELVVGITGARQGYLELRAPGGRVLSSAHGCSNEDVTTIRKEISGGILLEALKTGKTIVTASAVQDPRFSSRESVQAGRIEAVLCAPVGGTRPVGAVYLQGRPVPGPFSETNRALVELFARTIAPYAERLLAQAAPNEPDPTTELRARLQADALVGRSTAMAEVLRQMVVASGVDITVLITGESGTGKTEFARALHQSSRRAKGPFVELNCAAIPENLFEAELFGAEKGAHSTATRKLPGKISAAERGTLFLDEVGELPASMQAKLLQFLQSRVYYPLGSTAAQKADVRILAATNLDLDAAVAEKRFREDLFYRLNVLTVRVPSLRERIDDVPAIANHVLKTLAPSLGREMTLSSAAAVALQQDAWPGNIRQLSSALQRASAVALSEDARIIDVHHLHPDKPRDTTSATTYAEALRAFQRTFLQQALDACQGNVSETARRVDLARSHLHELLRSHGLGRSKTP